MNEQIVQLSKMFKVSNRGHILYVYDELDRYVKNAVSYIKTGIELGHHLLIIENKSTYEMIYQNLKEVLTHCELTRVHYVNNLEFYGDFNSEKIIKHFENIIKPFQNDEVPIRTWSHVEWKEQKEVQPSILYLEDKADECLESAGLISVCAYNGNQISATLQNQLLQNHEYFMTDYELVKSNFYRKDKVIFPSLSEQRDQRNMEQKLKATKHQLNSFIMHNLDPVLIYDMEDKIISVNHAFEKTFGWTAYEVLGFNTGALPFFPSDKQFEYNRNRSFLLSGEKIEGYETIRKTKEGNTLNVMVSCFPLWDAENKVNGWAVIIKDITEKKQVQDALIRSEKLSIAGELAASIAHEIRNPVTTIKGFLQLLQAGVTEKTNYYYQVMASEIDRIELILSELLMLAKPQAHNFQQKNISQLIKDVIALLIPQANMNNVMITTEFEDDETLLNCEENQIKQAFINFIKNAIDSMPNGGNLVIQMKSSNRETLLIYFIDQGSGIPEHLLSKLGQPFYTTKEKGTGLGFMVSKKIIENHHGTIAIRSKENKGTTIEVKLPF